MVYVAWRLPMHHGITPLRVRGLLRVWRCIVDLDRLLFAPLRRLVPRNG
jgi:hypothetical protein